MKRLVLVLTILALTVAVPRAADVRIRHDAAKQQYIVEVAGKPFTVYCYGAEFRDKPVFYPVMSPNGARVNREFPMVPGVPGESSDHPHHQSLFFTYDEVNGVHYWNPDPQPRHITQTKATVSGNRLVSELNWVDNDGKTALTETKSVTFGGDADVFWMDHAITLRAATMPVTFGDTKEGAFGIRLNDTLKETGGGSGRYVNAEGLETGAKVWGKTSAWIAIRGTVKDAAGVKPVTVAIFAHPTGLNFPPYWHARDYGLFAVNPFARKGYDGNAPERTTVLKTGERLNIAYRVAVYSVQVSNERLAQDFAEYRK